MATAAQDAVCWLENAARLGVLLLAVLAPLAQGGELAPSKKLMAAAKLSRGSSLLRWRRRGNLRQEPEVDDGVVWHIRVAPGAWRAVITELVAQGKDVACDFFFERK